MPGAADALQEGGNGASATDLTDQVDIADVDAELERSGGDQRAELARFEPALGFQSLVARQTAVVGGDIALPQAITQMLGDALGEASRVDEDDGGRVLEDELSEAVIDLLPHLVGHHSLERRGGKLESEIEAAAVAQVDDFAVAIAEEKVGDRGDRFLGRRESDAQHWTLDQIVEALEGEGEVGASLVSDHRMDLVDDDGVGVGEHPPSAFGGEEDVERLGGCHQDVGWDA